MEKVMKLTTLVCAIAALSILYVVGYRPLAADGVTPDQWMILAEDLPAMESALAAGASPDGAPDGFPALLYPLHRDFIPGVELLLEMGANPDGKPHARPLIHAVYFRRLEVTKLLLQHGANPNITDARGKTPLQVLETAPNPDPRIREALLQSGAHPHPKANPPTTTPSMLYNDHHDRPAQTH
jgi:ankyrin repeat protein